MVRKIVSIKDPILRQEARFVQKIDKKVLKIIEDLKDTLLSQKDPKGVGLAAPQIGVSLQIFVMLEGMKVRTLINPKIMSLSKKKNAKTTESENKILEGCLSLPNYYGPLARAQKVKISFLNPKTQEIEKEVFRGFDSQIVQHEIDHLNGVLFIDKLLEQKKPLYLHTGGEKWEEVELL